MSLQNILQGLVDHCRVSLGQDHVELELTLPIPVIDKFSSEMKPVESTKEDDTPSDSASVTKMFLEGGTVTLKGK